MALSIVNQFQHSPVTGASTTVKFGTSPAWTPTAGNTIVVGFTHGNSTTVSSIVDTLGNTYTRKGSEVTVPGSPNLAVYYCYNCLGGSPNIITVTFSASASFPAGYLYEISGAKTGDPTDIYSTGTVTSGTALSTGSFTTMNPNELVLCFMSGNGAGSSMSAGTGYTLDKTNFGSSGGNFWGVEHQLFSSIQTGVTATATGNSSAYSFAIAAIGIQAPVISGRSNSLMMMGCGT